MPSPTERMLDVEDKIIDVKDADHPTPKNSKLPIDPCIVEANQEPRRAAGWRQLTQSWLSSTSSKAQKTWSPSWAHFGPLSGLLSLCVVAGSLVAAIAILLGSDHSNVDAWPTPPSTDGARREQI